jgi:hypothetical protein
MNRKSKKPVDRDFSQLETYRQSLRAGLSFALFLSIASVLFFGALCTKSNNPKDTVLILFLIIMGYLGVSAHITAKYTKKLEKEFLPGLIKTLWNGSKYNPAKGLPQHEFESAKLFLYPVESFRSKRLIQAHRTHTSLNIAETMAAYLVMGPKGRAVEVKIFEGLFLTADFNKHTEGRTYIFPDNAERLLGRSGQSIQNLFKSYGQLIKLEDPEFEKYFAVYSTDQIEARYILSPSLMRNLLEFRKEVGTEVFVSFIDGKMYLA